MYYRRKILLSLLQVFDNQIDKISLQKENTKQAEILSLLKTKKRIALTCFEANIHQCHRKHLSESIANMEGFDYELNHI